MASPKESTSILEKEQTEDTGKRRIAHPSAATCISRQTIVNQQVKKSINPQQKMYERWRLTRDAVTEKSISEGSCVGKDIHRSHVEGTGVLCNNELKLNGNGNEVVRYVTNWRKKFICAMFATGRVRIAHVPYAKSLAIEKKKMTQNVGKSTETKVTDNSKTAAQTAKSGVRVAHVPQAVSPGFKAYGIARIYSPSLS